MDQGAAAVETQISSRGSLAIVSAMEVAVVFAGILLYIWRWQHSWPHAWMGLWALILASHVWHRDTWRTLGLASAGFRSSAQWVWPLAVVVYLPILFYGFADHHLTLLRPAWKSLLLLLGYGSWCAFQQYLAQSYFNNRLMGIIRNRHLTSALTGIMFGATHIPNLILVVATLVAGYVFAEVFARYRNIWPLAVAQAVGGLLIAAVAPDALIHHMRVGPSYLFYGIR